MKRSQIQRTGFAQKTYAEVLASRTIKKPRKPMRGVRIDQADKYFSLYIRYRDNWTCQRCFTKYEPVTNALHCSHFWGRARESTRFDPLNANAHCHGCHSFFTANPELHRQWKLTKIGQAEYDKLMIRAETRQKKDRPLMALLWQQEYEKEKLRYEQNQG
jgi:hypothetical protein